MQLLVPYSEASVVFKGAYWELLIYVCATPNEVFCHLKRILMVINFYERTLFLHSDVRKDIWHDTNSNELIEQYYDVL